jgi:hypothetical protein
MSVFSTLDKSQWAFPPPEVHGNHDYDVYTWVSPIVREAADSNSGRGRRDGPPCYRSGALTPFFSGVVTFLSALFHSRYSLGLEILALRQ